MRMRFWLGLGMVVLLLAGCDSNSDEPFAIDDYMGTYDGTATQRIELPDGTTTTQMTNGSVTFSSDAAGQVMLSASSATPGEAPLLLDGTYDETGMRFQLDQSELFVFEIVFDEDGDASGGGTVDFFDIILDGEVSGRLTPRQVDLELDFDVTEGNADVPTGSTASLEYHATR